jgi:uncharacterized linocin/CFP29 family protein
MDFFKRTLAPLTDRAWAEIAAEATRILEGTLTARRVVDVEGPKGLEFSAVNLGHLELADSQDPDGVRYGVRKVLPLVELRIPFDVGVWDFDDIERGARDPDTVLVAEAAKKLAAFEDRAVFHGFDAGCIAGLEKSTAGTPIHLGHDAKSLLQAITQGVVSLRGAGIGGPYAIVLGTDAWSALEMEPGYPLEKRVAGLTGGALLHSPSVQGGFLLSTRGGDFVLTLGQDASIGFEYQDKGTVRLYLMQSFTFQVLNPGAAVRLSP